MYPKDERYKHNIVLFRWVFCGLIAMLQYQFTGAVYFGGCIVSG